MNERYIHMRSSSPVAQYAAISIGYTTVTEPDGKVRVIGQIAMCSHKDQFSRKIARKIIDGRMKKYGPSIVDDLPNGMTSYDYITMKYHPDNFEDGATFVLEPRHVPFARPKRHEVCACQ